MDQQNPFSDIVKQFASKAGQSQNTNLPNVSALTAARQDMQNNGMQPPALGNTGSTPNVMKSDLEAGNIQGTTPSIVQAINALNNVIKTSQDKDTIATMRSVVSLLSQFVANDQQAQTSALMGSQDQQAQQQSQ